MRSVGWQKWLGIGISNESSYCYLFVATSMLWGERTLAPGWAAPHVEAECRLCCNWDHCRLSARAFVQLFYTSQWPCCLAAACTCREHLKHITISRTRAARQASYNNINTTLLNVHIPNIWHRWNRYLDVIVSYYRAIGHQIYNNIVIIWIAAI